MSDPVMDAVYSQFTVIGLLGPAGSGKDLVADWFVNQGFVKVAFADPMKRFARDAFGLTIEQLWGPSEERNKKFKVDEVWWAHAMGHMNEAADEIINRVLQKEMCHVGYIKLLEWYTWLRKQYPEEISAREILQTLGTEWGRAVDSVMWTRYAHETAAILRKGSYVYTQAHGVSPIPFYGLNPAGVVIPDHRFINEVAATQQAGGYVLRLRRMALEPKTVGIEGHRSENEQKGIPDESFDDVFEFPEGVDKVHIMLEAALERQTWKDKRHGSRS